MRARVRAGLGGCVMAVGVALSSVAGADVAPPRPFEAPAAASTDAPADPGWTRAARALTAARHRAAGPTDHGPLGFVANSRARDLLRTLLCTLLVEALVGAAFLRLTAPRYGLLVWVALANLITLTALHSFLYFSYGADREVWLGPGELAMALLQAVAIAAASRRTLGARRAALFAALTAGAGFASGFLV